MPDLPEADYNGYTFTFLSPREDTAGWHWITSDPRELVAEEQTEEPISDAGVRQDKKINLSGKFIRGMRLRVPY